MITSLFEQYQRPILAYLLRLVGDREWAEELCDNTLRAALRGQDQLPSIAEQRAWLYRIAHKTAQTAMRRHRLLGWLPGHKAKSRRAASNVGNGAFSQANASECALLQLPRQERSALLLFSHHGLSPAEVAVVLGLDEGVVPALLHRARLQYREAYEREVVDAKPC